MTYITAYFNFPRCARAFSTNP